MPQPQAYLLNLYECSLGWRQTLPSQGHLAPSLAQKDFSGEHYSNHKTWRLKDSEQRAGTFKKGPLDGPGSPHGDPSNRAGRLCFKPRLINEHMKDLWISEFLKEEPEDWPLIAGEAGDTTLWPLGVRAFFLSFSPSSSLCLILSLSLFLSQKPKGEKDQRRQHAQKEASQSLLIHFGLEGLDTYQSNMCFIGRVLLGFFPHSGHIMVFGTRIR